MTRPLGSTLRTGNGYVLVRTADGWRLAHRVEWERHHGPIPPGGIVRHRNGDTTDNRIANLELHVTGKTGNTRRLKSGYVIVLTADGWRYQHRVVWEKRHGPIPTGGVIHHKNHIRSDNRLANLELLSSNGLHMSRHHPAGQRYKGKRLSPEHRAKLSAAAKRRCADPAHREALRERGKLGAEKRWH